MKEVIKKLLRENLLNEESIQDFISGKGNFLYHGTNVNPSEFILDDDYNASEEPGNGVYSCDIPDGILFLTNDIKEAKAYGRYIIPFELPRKNIKVFKIDTDAPSIVWDDDFCGYSDYGMFEELYNGYDAVEVRGRNKSTFIAHLNAIKPRTDLAVEFYSKSLKEGLLNEALTDVDSDVNLIYDMYFRPAVEEIERTGKITEDMFSYAETNTVILKSELAKEAHKRNMCIIKINSHKNNFYDPNNKIIGISVNKGAVDYSMNFGGDIMSAVYSLNDEYQKRELPKEFSEERIKGSIHHELAHWVDDTMNNQHIKKLVSKPNDVKTKMLNKLPINATKMEIQAQIHNVKQLHNKYENIWDELTFKDMLGYSPALSKVYRDLPMKIKTDWIRNLKTRMHREGLLGKNMVNN
jgi:hypothetical protein